MERMSVGEGMATGGVKRGRSKCVGRVKELTTVCRETSAHSLYSLDHKRLLVQQPK